MRRKNARALQHPLKLYQPVVDISQLTSDVRLTALLGGGAQGLAVGEEDVDVEDLVAALTLSAHAHADLDANEAALIDIARGLGLSWSRIGFALGLGSAQAAQKRYARVSSGVGTRS